MAAEIFNPRKAQDDAAAGKLYKTTRWVGVSNKNEQCSIQLKVK